MDKEGAPALGRRGGGGEERNGELVRQRRTRFSSARGSSRQPTNPAESRELCRYQRGRLPASFLERILRRMENGGGEDVSRILPLTRRLLRALSLYLAASGGKRSPCDPTFSEITLSVHNYDIDTFRLPVAVRRVDYPAPLTSIKIHTRRNAAW